MNDELRCYVYEEIVPRYACFDAAHQTDHVLSVINDSLYLAQYYDVDAEMVLVVAAYHDLGLKYGREEHHIHSGRMLMDDERLKEWFTDDQLRVMSDAIEDHRASRNAEPRSVYGRIVAEADRQIDRDVTLRRTVQYGLNRYPELDREGQYERACEHLHNKYGENGYLKLYIRQSPNAMRLAEFRELISSPRELRKAFDAIYDEEIKKNRG